MGDETPLERPAYAPHAVTERLAHWMAQGCRELRIPHAKLAFHGGEPAMFGADTFSKACQTLRDILVPAASLSLAIPTNGVLLVVLWTVNFIVHEIGTAPFCPPFPNSPPFFLLLLFLFFFFFSFFFFFF